MRNVIGWNQRTMDLRDFWHCNQPSASAQIGSQKPRASSYLDMDLIMLVMSQQDRHLKTSCMFAKWFIAGAKNILQFFWSLSLFRPLIHSTHSGEKHVERMRQSRHDISIIPRDFCDLDNLVCARFTRDRGLAVFFW